MGAQSVVVQPARRLYACLHQGVQFANRPVPIRRKPCIEGPGREITALFRDEPGLHERLEQRGEPRPDCVRLRHRRRREILRDKTSGIPVRREIFANLRKQQSWDHLRSIRFLLFGESAKLSETRQLQRGNYFAAVRERLTACATQLRLKFHIQDRLRSDRKRAREAGKAVRFGRGPATVIG